MWLIKDAFKYIYVLLAAVEQDLQQMSYIVNKASAKFL